VAVTEDGPGLRGTLDRSWESFQKCLAAYDPLKHLPGSDAELRARIATFALDGIESRAHFEAVVRAGFEQHRKEIERAYAEWMVLVPNQIVLVADTLSIFESDWLLKRMQEGIERLTALRGSPIIPE